MIVGRQLRVMFVHKCLSTRRVADFVRTGRSSLRARPHTWRTNILPVGRRRVVHMKADGQVDMTSGRVHLVTTS